MSQAIVDTNLFSQISILPSFLGEKSSSSGLFGQGCQISSKLSITLLWVLSLKPFFWRIVKIISVQLRPALKLHWDSGNSSSAIFCRRSCNTLATNFPTTSSSAIPLQLSHRLRLPFLGIGIKIAFYQSDGTWLPVHTSLTSSSRHFMNSSS